MRLPNPFSLTLFALTVFFVVPLFTHAQGFVPLTTIPGLSTVSESGSIAAFLNNLYKISIGVAAVLAVLQITRAGIMYMTEESIAEKKEARHLITMSLLGLLLVLSPAIVFGIIDPRILDLNVDVSSIRPSGNGNGQGSGTGQGTGQGTGTQTPTTPTTPTNGGATQTGDGQGDGDTTPTEVDVTAPPLGPTVQPGAITSYSGPYEFGADGYYSSLGYLGRSADYDCMIMTTGVYASGDAQSALQTCQQRASSYTIAQCVRGGTTQTVQVQNVCAQNGRPLAPMQ